MWNLSQTATVFLRDSKTMRTTNYYYYLYCDYDYYYY